MPDTDPAAPADRPRAGGMQSWSPVRVRTRLLAAFLILLLAAVTLTLVGWIGLRGTQRALAAFEHDVLPGISHALELAERTAQLAALAPFVAESPTRENLDSNAIAAESLLSEIKRLSVDLHPSNKLQPVMGRLLDGVGSDLSNLIQLTQQRQALRDRLQGQLHRIDRAGRLLRGRGAQQPLDPALQALWSTLILGATTESQASMGELDADVEALLIAARRRLGGEALAEPQVATLVEIATSPDSTLHLRRDLSEVEQRISYLVGLTRTNADQLRTEVARHVGELRATASSRNEAVQGAIRSGETGMLAVMLVALLIAAVATRYVWRLVAQIENITAVMSRLAQGDTAQGTPAVSRRDELGALARSFEVFRDTLLAKHQLVTELKLQSELLDAVHNSMTDALAVFDRRGRLLLWNPRFAELLAPHAMPPRAGLLDSELLASFPSGSVWVAPGHTEPRPLAEAREVDFSAFGHIELHLHGGQVFDLRSRAMPDGGTVTLVTDLTTRRAIDNQIQHTQRLELLGQLTGGVAHDFNNQLGTILGNLSLLQDQPGLDGDGRSQLQRALRATVGASGLTRRLLAFARKQPLQAEQVPVDEMVEEMRDLIEYSAGARVEVVLELNAASAQVWVDRGQLENAVLNLVINSAAAMPAGGRLTIGTRRLQGRGPADVEIAVVDTGTGIPEHLLSRVFEPFFTTKPVTEGHGLGLSIVYGFVKQSGGVVELTSELGRGTRVALRFPVTEPRAMPLPERAAGAALPALPSHLRVLLVDDDEAFRATVSDLLKASRVTVIEASTTEEALRLLEASLQVDAVLSDVCLGPGMGGLRFAQLLRARWPRIRLTLMSGLSPELFAADADWDGSLPFLQKPFARELLQQWLHEQARHAALPDRQP